MMTVIFWSTLVGTNPVSTREVDRLLEVNNSTAPQLDSKFTKEGWLVDRVDKLMEKEPDNMNEKAQAETPIDEISDFPNWRRWRFGFYKECGEYDKDLNFKSKCSDQKTKVVCYVCNDCVWIEKSGVCEENPEYTLYANLEPLLILKRLIQHPTDWRTVYYKSETYCGETKDNKYHSSCADYNDEGKGDCKTCPNCEKSGILCIDKS